MSCPEGYELMGAECMKTVTVPYQTKEVPTVSVVEPEMVCPKGTTMSGKACEKVLAMNKIAKMATVRKPVTTCPKGAEGPSKDGKCTMNKWAQTTVVEPVAVPDRSTTVMKKPYEVPVSKSVSVPGPSTCPKGTSNDKKGNCIVEGLTTEYETMVKEVALSIPVNTPSSITECPEGTYEANGKGKGGDCVAQTSQQTVETLSSEKTVRNPVLASKVTSYSLPAEILKSTEVCPQGSTANKDGTCSLTLSRSTLEPYSVTVASDYPVLEEFPQTLTLTRVSLVPTYYCPKGTTPVGGTEDKKGGVVGDASLICQVDLPAGTPTTVSAPVIMKKARFEKRPVEVTVNKVEAVPVEYCPKGSTEDKNGNCVVTVTTQKPVTTTQEHTECPPGSEFTTGSKAAKCKKPTMVTVPATQLPGDMKSKVPQYSCPEGTTPVGEGPSMECAAPTWEEVPMESFTTTSVSFVPKTVTEVVPKLYRYETRTVTETAMTEEVYTVYDEIVLEETSADVVHSTTTETVPALVRFDRVVETETQTVTNSRVAYYPCIPADGVTPVASSYGHGDKHDKHDDDDDKHGHHDYVPSSSKKGSSEGSGSCLVETHYKVVTETYTELVPAVASYYVEQDSSASAMSTAEETYLTYETTTMTETSSSVATTTSNEVVPANVVTSYHTTSEPQTVTETHVITRSVPMTETVTAIPTFSTVVEQETATSEEVYAAPVCPAPAPEKHSSRRSRRHSRKHHEEEEVEVDTKKGCTLEETRLGKQTTMISEEVLATTEYVEESYTSYVCPPGTTDDGKTCTGMETVPAVPQCPKGAEEKHGDCLATVMETMHSCPKGFTDTGKQCTMTETVPAFSASSAVYSKEGYEEKKHHD